MLGKIYYDNITKKIIESFRPDNIKYKETPSNYFIEIEEEAWLDFLNKNQDKDFYINNGTLEAKNRIKSLEEMKNKKINEVIESKYNFISNGFKYKVDNNDYVFFMDNDSLTTLNVKQRCCESRGEDYTFYTMNREQINFGSIDEFNSFYYALFLERNRIDKLSNSLKGQINQCATEEELNNIQINFSN